MIDEKLILQNFYKLKKNIDTEDIKTGYVIETDEVKAICISPLRNYGGGSLTLWAIEGVEAQLTLGASRYVHGICMKIYENEMAIDFKPIKGKWRDLDEGPNKEVRRIKIDDIRRYDRGFY